MQLTALGCKQLVDAVSFLEFFCGLAPCETTDLVGTFSANLQCVVVSDAASEHYAHARVREKCHACLFTLAMDVEGENISTLPCDYKD